MVHARHAGMESRLGGVGRRLARPVLDRLRRARRKAWCGGRRVYLQIRALDAEVLREVAPRIERAFEARPEVLWARVNGHLQRLVVEVEGDVAAIEPVLAAMLDELEVELGLEDAPLPIDAVNPGDRLPLGRVGLELGAEAFGLTVNALRRRRGGAPWGIDVAAATAVLEGIPKLRKVVARRLGSEATDLVLQLTKAVASVALGSETGPLTSAARHVLRLRDESARKRVWIEREAELGGRPELHEAIPVPVPPRTHPLRPGPIERYDEEAVPIAMAVFGAGVLFSRAIDEGALALFGGLPAAAHRGRSAFAHHLSWLLAQRGVLVTDTVKLRILDRLDVMVVQQDLLDPRSEVAASLLEAARAAELEVVVAGEPGSVDAWGEEGIAVDEVVQHVRDRQARGRGVLFVADGPHPGHRVADLSVASNDAGTPWGADVICRHGLHDVKMLVEASMVARRVATEGVWLAMAEAGLTAVLAYGGLRRRTTRRVMLASHAAAAVAMANGVRRAHGLTRPAPPPPRRRADPWHALSVEEVLTRLETRAEGLAEEEAAARTGAPPPRRSRRGRFVKAMGKELDNPMTPVLGAGVGLSALTGSIVDAGLLASAVALNGVVGGVQRLRTQDAVSALRKRERHTVRVLRDGEVLDLPTSRVVVGDVVELHSGDSVHGDCRLLWAENLQVEESAVTGESLPVDKSPEPVSGVPVAERSSMLYDGTSIAAGSCRAVVVALDEDTELGRAAAAAIAEAPDETRGVEARLQQLGSFVGPLAGVSAAAMALSGLVHRRPIQEVVSSAVSLGVASVPEGLPVLATMAQLAAARRLSTRGALVTDPRAIEPLGRVDVLCADKTGTLTEGDIRLHLVSDGRHDESLERLSRGGRGILAVALRASPPPDAEVVPHATDRALLVGAARVEVDAHHGRDAGWQRIAELPFEPARGFHATLEGREDARTLSVKGAPEVVLPRCASVRSGQGSQPMTEEARAVLVDRAGRLACRGFRVLVVADRTLSGAGGRAQVEDEDVRELCFRGFVAYKDPVRPSAKQAIEDLRRAGVEVLMVTGDHPSTAEAIGDELGISRGRSVMTGDELDALDEDALAERILEVGVFARVTPVQKVRIVEALRRKGKSVGMTGDGANDAPAIELADVGIALGDRATPAAREAADLVVTDGRIETILGAVLEGRALWRSVRDAVAILVGGNLGEVAFTVLGGLGSGRAPVNARQVLLVNLVTDTFPALAIALRPPRDVEPEQLLREGPEASLGSALERDIAWRATVTAGAAGGAWIVSRLTLAGPQRAGTVGLLALCGAQLGQTLVTGGRSLPVLAASLGSLAVLFAIVQTPGLSHFFGSRPLGPLGLTQAAGASALATGASITLPVVWRITDKLASKLARDT